MSLIESETFDSWTEFLQAIRDDRLRFEEGAHATVVYDSSYSDEPQTIEGEVSAAYNSMGRPFVIDNRVIRGWHVNTGIDNHKIGRVETIEFEVATDA